MRRILIATSNPGKLRDFAGAASSRGIEIASVPGFTSLPAVVEVDALGGAPGVHSARYAADAPHLLENNTEDEANNARLIRELRNVPPEKRTGRFVCEIAAARDGDTLAVFRGQAEGIILDRPRGSNGFGYDPLFYFPRIQKTFAELTAEEKAGYSHRGAAFRQFLEWYQADTAT